MTPIFTPKAPRPIGIYSQAARVGEWLFISGQIGMNPETMDLAGEDLISQMKQIFNNLKAILNEAGADFHQIVKMTIFLTDMKEFPTVNEVCAHYFQPPFPARSTVEVRALPKGARVEVEAIAFLSA